MKKMLLSLMILTPLLAGCANINTDITINDNKSAEVSTELVYQGKLNEAKDTTAQSILKSYENFLDNKYKIETVYDYDKSTIKATKRVKDLSKQDLDLSSLGFTSKLESGKFIEIKKNFVISSYNIDLVYDYNKNLDKLNIIEEKADNTSKGLQPEYYQKYGDMSEMEAPEDREDVILSNIDEDTKQFTDNAVEEIKKETATEAPKAINAEISVRVPGFASYNNADNAEGNIYRWTVRNDEPTEIKLQYVRYSGFAIAVVILILTGLLVLLAKKIIKHESQKRIDNIDNIV